MTRIDQVKADFDAGKLTRKVALDRLEALGMWVDEAETLLALTIEDI